MKCALLLTSLLGMLPVRALPPAPGMDLNVTDDAARGVVTVKIGDKPFTELHYKGYAKPVLYPIIGPTGASLTRQWPMTETAAPGEERDHPHHKGLWFTHGSVNGVDFWSETDKAGRIIVTGKPELFGRPGLSVGGNSSRIETSEEWKAPDGKVVCTSRTSISCSILADEVRIIDYTITIKASEGDVVFGDTKEGTMGLRSHPALNLTGKVAAGHAVNSEGKKDADIWGQHAKWVDYSGPIDGKVTGIACFDHPSNLRHPTTWHARDYGLIAANPFGLHDFKKEPKGAGDYTLSKGESLTFRYRWFFHTGDATDAKIEAQWKQWADQKITPPEGAK